MQSNTEGNAPMAPSIATVTIVRDPTGRQLSPGMGADLTCGTALNAGESVTRLQSDVALQHWWQEPLMWLVVGLPASVVVAGVWTVILASRSAL